MSRMMGASGLRWVVTVETDRVGGRHTAGVATPVVTDREWHESAVSGWVGSAGLRSPGVILREWRSE